MSDLSDLHGVYPTSIRWNAESGFLAVSAFNAETGERELQQIELGQAATFVLDLATRERGYGLIKTGIYDMRLTPVGSPPPPWPEDEEYKPALGMLDVELPPWRGPTRNERAQDLPCSRHQCVGSVSISAGGRGGLATRCPLRRSRPDPGQVGP